MNLIDLQNIDKMEEALMLLLSAENALNYNRETLMDKFVEGTTEEECLALELCGTSCCGLVLGFIEGSINSEEFLTNVAFNSNESLPLIVRVINLALINRRAG